MHPHLCPLDLDGFQLLQTYLRHLQYRLREHKSKYD